MADCEALDVESSAAKKTGDAVQNAGFIFDESDQSSSQDKTKNEVILPKKGSGTKNDDNEDGKNDENFSEKFHKITKILEFYHWVCR